MTGRKATFDLNFQTKPQSIHKVHDMLRVSGILTEHTNIEPRYQLPRLFKLGDVP